MFSKNGNQILFYPERPSKHSVIFKILKRLNYPFTKNVRKDFNLIISWEDTTFRNSALPLQEPGCPVINKDCNDISKEHIDRIFEKVFGYRLNVDPLKSKGKLLKKSHLNAVKDGLVIDSPIKAVDDAFVYQKIVNNYEPGKGFEDIRVPVFKSTIPLVFLKYRSFEKRFSDNFEQSVIRQPEDVFCSQEVQKIKAFSLAMGLDYGELDILRDRDCGKIYIVDANNTPWGPPDELTHQETEQVLGVFAESFYQAFIYKV